MNAIAGLLIAFYLFGVAYNDNTQILWDNIKRQKDFIPWAFALLGLYTLDSIPNIKRYTNPLMGLLILSIIIQIERKNPGITGRIRSQLNQLFK